MTGAARLKRWAVVVALATSPVSGCTCSETGTPPAPVAPKPAVPAPAGLVLELVVPAPSTLLTDARAAMAGPMLLLPKSVGGLAVNLLGLPVTAAELFDEGLPLVGASLAEGKGPDTLLHSAFAIHVKDGRRLVARLTTGPDATFEAKVDGELTWLTAKDNLRQARLETKLATVDNYLVVGDGERAVAELGPYLARTVGRAAPPKDDLVVELKDAETIARLADRLGRLQESAASLPVPEALGAVIDLPSSLGAVRELLQQVGAASVVANLDPEGELVIEASLEAKGALERAALATLPAITPSRLATLPDGTVGAMQWAESTDGRDAEAERRARGIRATLGLAKDDEAELTSALQGIGRGQGERMLVALRCTGVGLTGLAEGDVRDAEALAAGVEGLTAMAERPALKQRLAAERMGVEVSVTRARHIPDDVHLVRLTKLPDPGEESERAEPLPPIDLRYVISDERFYAAAGTESLTVLQHLHEPDPERQWGLASGMKAAIDRLGASAWLAVAADPHALNACLRGKPGGAFSTPATFVVGPAEGGAKARLELASGLLVVVGRELF